MSNSILKANGVCKAIQGKLIVNKVNITVETGQIKGILGPNGAGKTTLFYILAGLISCDSGSVMLDKINITKFKLPKRAKLGLAYLPQDSSIFRGLSVKDNILAILELRNELEKDERHHQLEILLEKFQLNKIRNTKGELVSGGERRRVEIARAIATDPKFILLDEPFAGIDPVSVTEIKQIMTNIVSNNIGILITDHNVRETLKICKSAEILHGGEIINSGSATTIMNDTKVREVYLGNEFNI